MERLQELIEELAAEDKEAIFKRVYEEMKNAQNNKG